jgi:hypothetical protein
VLWREALGPRGGAAREQPMLKDYLPKTPVPDAERPPAAGTVFTGGRHEFGTKEFPT